MSFRASIETGERNVSFVAVSFPTEKRRIRARCRSWSQFVPDLGRNPAAICQKDGVAVLPADGLTVVLR